MASAPLSFSELAARVCAFRDARDFAQFHNPKDLAVAIATEAGELLEHFLWLTPAQAVERASEREDALAGEAADVLAYLILFCDNAGIDLLAALDNKLVENERRYPVEEVRGDSLKHSDRDLRRPPKNEG